jgi:hypothetical protein
MLCRKAGILLCRWGLKRESVIYTAPSGREIVALGFTQGVALSYGILARWAEGVEKK